jgi:hypothetical protein
MRLLGSVCSIVATVPGKGGQVLRALRQLRILLLLPLVSCGGDSEDQDQDGWTAEEGDCDDRSHRVNPEAEESCNGIDDDCDGEIDEEVPAPPTWYWDWDGDGYGSDDDSMQACQPLEAYVPQGGDCDDRSADVHPGAEERCDDRDEDCDGEVDEDAVDASIWYLDEDGDGWGDPDAPFRRCTKAWNLTDASMASDCDDLNFWVNPGAEELCNGIDDDCDGEVDEEAVDSNSWYLDADGDGWGDEEVAVAACEQPEGHAAEPGDCDDGDASLHPETLWYWDYDQDGYGNPSVGLACCEDPSGEGSSYVSNDSDCDDYDADIHPAAADACDGVDNDCDGADEGCEDCGNGVDDNGDGLVDCEDASCFDDPLCYEATCDDGLDNEGDGLADCDDDDCWGTVCHPAGVRSRVLGAGAVSWPRSYRFHSGGDCGASGHHGQYTWYWLRAESVYGTVQVLPEGVSSWDATTARTTCTWWLRSAAASMYKWETMGVGYSSGLSPGLSVARSGLAVESGCRLGDDDWFLPQRPWLEGDTAWASYSRSTYMFYSWTVRVDLGPVWYLPGPLVSSTRRSSRTSHDSHGCYGGRELRSWTWLRYAGLESGSSYQAGP